MEREAFLAQVRARQASAVLPTVTPGPLFPTESREDVVEWFVESATAVGAKLHRAGSSDEVRETVRRIASETGSSVFATWDDAQIPVRGIGSYLGLSGMDEHVVDIPRETGRAESVAALERIDLGVTGADAAFARSGAIVLEGGPGRPRMTSLVPRIHVAVVRAVDVHASFSTWAEQHPDVLRRSANLVFVAGPSRSADIEFSLSIGVHGPGELHVVLI